MCVLPQLRQPQPKNQLLNTRAAETYEQIKQLAPKDKPANCRRTITASLLVRGPWGEIP